MQPSTLLALNCGINDKSHHSPAPSFSQDQDLVSFVLHLLGQPCTRRRLDQKVQVQVGPFLAASVLNCVTAGIRVIVPLDTDACLGKFPTYKDRNLSTYCSGFWLGEQRK